jgi:DHA1 family multidrug resistance protein-like MFS transporter
MRTRTTGPGRRGGQISRPLELLFACLLVVMIGYGITFTVLPFYAERIHGLTGIDQQAVAFHIGLLTSVYALAQLVASPVVGRLGDRIGRRPILLGGLAGMAVTQGVFGLTSSLAALYAIRVLAGVATAGALVTASAYVADLTSVRDRSRGMAGFGTAVSLGLVGGPLLGGVLSRPGFSFGAGWLRVDGYSLPFLVAGLLALGVLIVAWRGLPESQAAEPAVSDGELETADAHATQAWPGLGLLLSLVTASQFGLALFEGTFVLYARDRIGLVPEQASLAFMVCGLVMAVLQLLVVGSLARVVPPLIQVAAGFALMGAGVFALVTTRVFPVLLALIAVLALGTALVVPNLSALVSERSHRRAGAALGLKGSASSLGQFVGPLLGGILLGWRASSPFVVGGVLLLAVGLAVGLSYPMRTR